MMLCTLTTLKTYLGITGTAQDEELTLLIKMVGSQIQSYLGYPLERQEIKDEVHSVNFEQLLLLDNQPVQSVSSVSIAGAEITDYKVIPKYAKVGMLYRGGGWCGGYYTRGMAYDVVSGMYDIAVSYTSGYYMPDEDDYTEGDDDSLPYDIQTACLVACAELYNLRSLKADGIASYSEGGQSTTFANGGSMADCGLSDKVCAMLVDYKRQAVA